MPTEYRTRPGRRPVSFLFCGLMTLALLVSCGGLPGGGAVSSELGDLAEVEFTSVSGDPVRLADFVGQVVIVDFWATWCSPCRLQADILHELHQELEGREVQFLAVSLGEPEDIVRDFAERNPFPYPVLMDPKEILGQALDIYALPTVMVLNPSGGISFLRPGVSNSETLKRALAELDAAAT